MARLTIRCSDEDHEAFQAAAHGAHTSLNNWVLGRLRVNGSTGVAGVERITKRLLNQVVKPDLVVDRVGDNGLPLTRDDKAAEAKKQAEIARLRRLMGKPSIGDDDEPFT